MNVLPQWPTRKRAPIDLPCQLDVLPITPRLDAPYLDLLTMYELHGNQRFRTRYSCAGGSASHAHTIEQVY